MERILKYMMLMLIATLSLMFTACGSDDDEPNNSGKAIDLANTRLELTSWTGAACDVFDETLPFNLLVFHSDGSVTESNFESDTYITGTYTVWGNKVTFSGLSRWSTIWGSTFTISSNESWDGKEMISFVSTLTSYTSAAAGFNCYVSRLNNGNSGGNSGGGNSGGGSSDHHFPCKSCDETGDCWNCYGRGIDPITNKECNTCHGSGKCQICHGKGYIIV